MSEIEITTDGGRPRRGSAAETLRIARESLYDGKSISALARRNGIAPDRLYRWRKRMREGGGIAVAEDHSATGNRTVRERENRIREAERQRGRKVMDVDILKEALDKARSENRPCLRSR